MMAKKRKLVRRRSRVRRDGPHPVDVHVGGRIRQRRTLLGISQAALAEALCITFQQVQKYEKGKNRVGSSRLFEMSRIFDVPVEYFYEDMDTETAAATSRIDTGQPSSHPVDSAERDPLNKRETLELVRAYYRITDPLVRKRVFELTKALGKTGRER